MARRAGTSGSATGGTLVRGSADPLGHATAHEQVAPPSVRVPGISPAPRWRPGAAPPRGRDSVTTRSPGRGRGLDRPGPTRPPWAVLVPASAACIDARSQQPAEFLRQIAVLPSQAWVSIVDDRPLSGRRLRRLAERAGLVIERELVVLASPGSGVTVIEDVTAATGLRLPLLGSWRRWLATQHVVLARRL